MALLDEIREIKFECKGLTWFILETREVLDVRIVKLGVGFQSLYYERF